MPSTALFKPRISRQNNCDAARVDFSHGANHIKTVLGLGNVQIGDKHVEFVVLNLLQCVGNAACALHAKPMSLQNQRQGCANSIFIIDEQKALTIRHRLRQGVPGSESYPRKRKVSIQNRTVGLRMPVQARFEGARLYPRRIGIGPNAGFAGASAPAEPAHRNGPPAARLKARPFKPEGFAGPPKSCGLDCPHHTPTTYCCFLDSGW